MEKRKNKEGNGSELKNERIRKEMVQNGEMEE